MFDIVNVEESASEAWVKLVQHYKASGLKERRRLTNDFYLMKMKLREHPRKFLLRVDQTVKELERVDRPVDPKGIDVVILSALTPQYDVKVRMLESSSDWPTRRWIERAVINQDERLQCETSAAGSRAMLSARGDRRNAPFRCPLCSRTGHSPLQCREFHITRRERKLNGYQRDGEHSGNGGGGGNIGGGDNGSGGGGNRGGRGNKNRSGGGCEQKKSSRDSESGDNTGCPDCYFCLASHKASECPNRFASATAPATSNFQHGVILGSVHTNLGAGLLVATSNHPALAARGAPRERLEDTYWVADIGAAENMTQDVSNLEDYAPPPPRRQSRKRRRGYSPCCRIWAPTTSGGPR